MRKKGLEPPRREAPDPKSGAATNYATSAKDLKEAKVLKFADKKIVFAGFIAFFALRCLKHLLEISTAL